MTMKTGFANAKWKISLDKEPALDIKLKQDLELGLEFKTKASADFRTTERAITSVKNWLEPRLGFYT